ncbi:MAG: hypothetical protein ABSC25_19485 [Roseiarcus sp.]
MDDTSANQTRASLDAILANRKATVGIGFGISLFDEFKKRGWFTLESFAEWGSAEAYEKTHLAFVLMNLPVLEFKVGSDS